MKKIYNKEIEWKLQQAIIAGVSETEMAQQVGVTRQCIQKWKKTQPGLIQAQETYLTVVQNIFES